MGSQILIHEKNPTAKTTNLGLKSIAYNNSKSYQKTIDIVNSNNQLVSSAIGYTTTLNNIITNLSAAQAMLANIVETMLRNAGKSSEIDEIKRLYAL